MRGEARRHLSFNIGAESDLLMWHDPWLNNRPLILRMGNSIISIAESSNLAKIKMFITDGRWVPPRSNHVLAIELRHHLASIPIYRKDEILWQNNKKVTMALIWNSIRRTGTQPPWATAVWHSYSIPKCAFFMWLALKMRLLTKDKMIAFDMNVNINCILCNGSPETAEHLFTTCPYTNLVIGSSPVPISNSWSDWQNGEFTQGPTTNSKKLMGWLFISILIYYIWQERNNRIHNSGSSRPTIQLMFLIKNMLREKLFSCSSFKQIVARDPSLIPLLY